MLPTCWRLRAVLPPLCFCAVLAGCASKAPAPEVTAGAPRVIEGAPPVATPEPVPATPVARPAGANEYVVKKGDTLYAIALDHGVDYKDLARWNGIANVNVIRVGQVLTMAEPGLVEAPPADGVTVKPVLAAAPAPIALDAPPASAPVAADAGGANSAEVKRSPKGGKVPFSDAALAHARAQGGAMLPPTNIEAAPAVTTPTTTAAAQPAPAVVPPPAAAPTTAAATPTTVAAPPPATDAAANGALSWAWPGAGKLLAGFVEGGNKGMDLGGKIGDPGLAAAPGKVSYVGSSLRGYGKMIVVKHNADYLSVYAHNSKVLVAEGQAVSAGQKIAELGDSDTDAPKLHFEIRRQGKPVNPAGFLPPR